MTDLTPIDDNRIAYWVGRVLHPYWLPTPTLLILLNDRPWTEAVGWLILTTLIVLMPSAGAVWLLERQGYRTYERRTRRPLYVVGFLCVLVCLTVLVILQAPSTLIACVIALMVWAPVQAGINAAFTKISVHTAVAAGCVGAVLITGKVESWIVSAALFGLVVLIGWSRMVTRHHTFTQVTAGAIVGLLPILIVFPLILI